MYERRSFAPVKVGDELDVKIEAVGEKGDGIAKSNGFVLFVPNTNTGDEVKIKVTKVLRKFGFGEVVGKAKAPEEAETKSEDSEETAEKPEETKETEETEETEAEDTEDFGEDSEQ